MGHTLRAKYPLVRPSEVLRNVQRGPAESVAGNARKHEGHEAAAASAAAAMGRRVGRGISGWRLKVAAFRCLKFYSWRTQEHILQNQFSQ